MDIFEIPQVELLDTICLLLHCEDHSWCMCHWNLEFPHHTCVCSMLDLETDEMETLGTECEKCLILLDAYMIGHSVAQTFNWKNEKTNTVWLHGDFKNSSWVLEALTFVFQSHWIAGPPTRVVSLSVLCQIVLPRACFSYVCVCVRNYVQLNCERQAAESWLEYQILLSILGVVCNVWTNGWNAFNVSLCVSLGLWSCSLVSFTSDRLMSLCSGMIL